VTERGAANAATQRAAACGKGYSPRGLKVPESPEEAHLNPIEQRLASVLSRHWWLLLLRGLAAIAFGVLTWVQPGISLSALVLLFGAYSMVDGVLATWAAIAGAKDHDFRWVLLLEGLLGIGVGILTFIAPAITALALLFYIAIWAIATGVLEIAAAIRLRKEIKNEWLLILAGLASVIFGALLAAQPGTGALALLWLIASYAVVFGVLLVVLAFKTRRFAGISS
jgi:uncharacterized membrane protein HdeD (DUF308 family)